MLSCINIRKGGWRERAVRVAFVLDEKDFAIIDALRGDSSASLQKLYKKTGIPTATLHYRLRTLKQEGVIKRYTIEIDYKKTGKEVLAFSLIEASSATTGGKNLPKTMELLRRVPGVEEAVAITGSVDVLLKIRASSIDELSEMILKRIRLVPGVAKVNTMLALPEKKE